MNTDPNWDTEYWIRSFWQNTVNRKIGGWPYVLKKDSNSSKLSVFHTKTLTKTKRKFHLAREHFCAMCESLPEPLEYEAVPEVPERLSGDIPGLLLHHLLLQLVPHRLQLCLSKRRDSRMRYLKDFLSPPPANASSSVCGILTLPSSRCGSGSASFW